MSRPFKWSFALVAGALVLSPGLVFADEVFRIRVGRNDREDSNRELQRRVWELERAVEQLQQRIYQLEAPPPPPVVVAPPTRWTCTVSAFGKTYMKTARSRGEAAGAVMQECANANHEMHCRSVKCSE